MEIKHISHFQDDSGLKSFGLTPDNEEILSFELSNKKGMKVQLINYGATVTSIKIPVVEKLVDVVLGFDTLESYIGSYNLPSAPYFGTTVGRYAGRINKGIFTLNGKEFQLPGNNNGNALHGGNEGFGKKTWTVSEFTSGENPSITFSLLSENLDQNYPGALQVYLKYTLTEANELKLEYKATTTEDTVINLTHHSYFNLNGHGSTVLDQEMSIASDKFLETNSENIPTGKFTPVSGHDFDFRNPKNCPASIDNSFVIEPSDDVVATLYSPKTKLKMSVYTDQPSVHIYVGGNCFDTLKGKENADYHPSSGICFETQNFPDAPNHAHFPNSILKKGEEYNQTTVYKFENVI
ncbi:aldose epimerase family protein [Flavobacterium daemonense]|uniref:aldose epimerase family protein n=1 Tax=Flavobacterium daemonense TaxID=1393049 RepID=UPI001186D392|nr:aldose epimerase family protein [Flavobacterium daemonense]KAF2336378.1 galactose mutarotase [Flavobacterium daemonense]